MILTCILLFFCKISVGQFTKKVISGNGMTCYITPEFSLSFDRGQVLATLTSFKSRVDGEKGFMYQSMWTNEPKFYNSESFGGALWGYFNKLEVESFGVVLKTKGPNKACTSAAQPMMKVGHAIQVCGSPTEDHGFIIEDYEIPNCKVNKELIDLWEKINELEKASLDKANKEEKQKSEKKEKVKELEEKQKKYSSENKSYYATAATAISRGNNYLKQGNYAMALREFELAQTSYQAAGYYDQVLAQKISDVKMAQGSAQLAQGLKELGDLLDNTLAKLDPDGKFTWSFIGLSYETSIPKNSNVVFSQPSIDMQLSFLSFAFGLKFGYMQSKLQEFNVDMRNSYTGNRNIPEKVIVSNKGINLELSAGFSIPIKNFNIRPMYGISLLSADDYEFESKDFSLKDELPYNLKLKPINRFSLGLFYQFPKTSVGIGLNASYLTQSKYNWSSNDSEKAELIYNGNNPEYDFSHAFYIGNTKTTEKMNNNTITGGVSFIFGIGKKR